LFFLLLISWLSCTAINATQLYDELMYAGFIFHLPAGSCNLTFQWYVMCLVVETSQIIVSLRTRVGRRLSGSVPSQTHLLSWYVAKSYYTIVMGGSWVQRFCCDLDHLEPLYKLSALPFLLFYSWNLLVGISITQYFYYPLHAMFLMRNNLYLMLCCVVMLSD